MVTQSRLKELMNYDPETGLFTWKVRRSGVTKGAIAGTPDTRGYVIMKIDYRCYHGHRLAWLYVTGEMPQGQIDHIDLNRTNNRFTNLRIATLAENQGNTGKRPGTSSPYKGVSFHKRSGKWMARLGQKWLGTFTDPAEAHAVYQRAADADFGEFARYE